jgi:uncharacterized membrane protein YdjX (TVP38/TMEM64 family)
MALFESALVSLVESYGHIGLTLVMIVQTIIAPIPSEALLVFAGAVLPLYDVLVFGGLGLIVGSIIAFHIARRGGRPVVAKIIGEKWTKIMDDWVTENGIKAILLTRIVPIIPFDLVSYVSGITPISFGNYLIATIIGAVPRILFLAYVGSVLGETFVMFGGTLELVFVVGIAGFIILAYLERKGYINQLENTILGKVVKKIWSR